MSKEWAIQKITAMATADMSKFTRVLENGQVGIDWKKAAEAGALGYIREVNLDKDTGQVVRFKLVDQRAALETVLKLHGLLVDKREVSGPGGKPIALILCPEWSPVRNEPSPSGSEYPRANESDGQARAVLAGTP